MAEKYINLRMDIFVYLKKRKQTVKFSCEQFSWRKEKVRMEEEGVMLKDDDFLGCGTESNRLVPLRAWGP